MQSKYRKQRKGNDMLGKKYNFTTRFQISVIEQLGKAMVKQDKVIFSVWDPHKWILRRKTTLEVYCNSWLDYNHINVPSTFHWRAIDQLMTSVDKSWSGDVRRTQDHASTTTGGRERPSERSLDIALSTFADWFDIFFAPRHLWGRISRWWKVGTTSIFLWKCRAWAGASFKPLLSVLHPIPRAPELRRKCCPQKVRELAVIQNDLIWDSELLFTKRGKVSYFWLDVDLFF